MTPITEAIPGSPEALYTKWFCRTRSLIERTNGVLKMRFRYFNIAIFHIKYPNYYVGISK